MDLPIDPLELPTPRSFRAVVDLVRDAVLVLQPSGAIIEVNHAAVRMYGYSRAELTQMNIRQLRAPSSARAVATELQDANRQGVLFDAEHVTKDGRLVIVEVSSLGSDAASGRVLVSVIRDVTDHRCALAALSRAEANFRAFFEHSPQPMALQSEGRFTFVNRAWVAMLRYADAASMLGLSIYDAVHPDEHEAVRARIDAGVRLGIDGPRVERRLARADGTLVTVLLSTVPLSIEGRSSLVIQAHDLTEQKALESQLAIADRMTSVGTLAAGVAHEINNPLAYVANNLEFANGELQSILGLVSPESPLGIRLAEVAQALREAEIGADRVRQIVLDLKTFSRIDDEKRGAVDVRKTLDLAISMANNEIKHRAQLVFTAVPTAKVEANEAKLGQVFLNILINAAQAIPEGRADTHVIRVNLGSDERRRVIVTITDDGGGIPKEIRDRIFDPFFTTKPQGIGTGLGLAICHNIVRNMKGEIAIESEVGVGTTVRITLPPAMSALQRVPTNYSLRPRPARARILLIDDEPMIGAAVRRILEAEHDVTLLTSARDALDRIKAGEHFDVILCDLMMPQMTGMDLYETLATASPDHAERMRFVTGGTFTERARSFVDERADRVISKPFRAKLLRKMIAEMFTGPTI